jgi:hypothetical protein
VNQLRCVSIDVLLLLSVSPVPALLCLLASDNTYSFGGNIADVQLFNRFLSAADAKAIYTVGSVQTTPAPVSRWNFAGQSGTTAVDTIGSNHLAAVQEPLSWASSHQPTWITTYTNFTGAFQGWQCALASSHQYFTTQISSHDYSFSMWLYFTALPLTGRTMVFFNLGSCDPVASDSCIQLYLTPAAEFAWSHGLGNVIVSLTDYSTSLGRWLHVAGVYQSVAHGGSLRSMWINNVQIAFDNSAAYPADAIFTGGGLTIGGPTSGDSGLQYALSGGMSQVKIWSRRLSVSDVSKLYANEEVSSASLLVHYPLDDNTLEQTWDASGNNINLVSVQSHAKVLTSTRRPCLKMELARVDGAAAGMRPVAGFTDRSTPLYCAFSSFYDGHLQIPSNAAYQPKSTHEILKASNVPMQISTQSYSWSVWLSRSAADASATAHTILQFYDSSWSSSSTVGHQLHLFFQSDRFGWGQGGYSDLTPDVHTETNVWSLWSGTFTTATNVATIYKNGVKVSNFASWTSPLLVSDADNTLLLGCSYSLECYEGGIDELRIYGRVLLVSEFLVGLKENTWHTNLLRLYLPLNEQQGDAAYDRSGRELIVRRIVGDSVTWSYDARPICAKPTSTVSQPYSYLVSASAAAGRFHSSTGYLAPGARTTSMSYVAPSVSQTATISFNHLYGHAGASVPMCPLQTMYRSHATFTGALVLSSRVPIALDMDGDFTYSYWTVRHATTCETMSILTYGPMTATPVANQFFTTGFDCNKASMSFSSNVVTSWDSFTQTGQWSYYLGTYNANSGVRRIFRDGILVATDVSPSALYVTSGVLQIGSGETPVFGGRLVGGVAEVRIWSRTLSDVEIQRAYRYNEHKSLAMSAYFPLTEESGLDARDHKETAVFPVAGVKQVTSYSTYIPHAIPGAPHGFTSASTTLSSTLSNRDFSFSVWAKRDVMGGNYAAIFSVGACTAPTSHNCLSLSFESTNELRFSLWSNTEKTTNAADLIRPGKWVHIACTYLSVFTTSSTSSRLIYIDGRLAAVAGTADVNFDFNGLGPLMIGAWPAGTSTYSRHLAGVWLDVYRSRVIFLTSLLCVVFPSSRRPPDFGLVRWFACASALLESRVDAGRSDAAVSQPR